MLKPRCIRLFKALSPAPPSAVIIARSPPHPALATDSPRQRGRSGHDCDVAVVKAALLQLCLQFLPTPQIADNGTEAGTERRRQRTRDHARGE